MPTIQRRGKGYRVMVQLKGRPPQYASFERKRDAEEWGMGVESAIREGRHFAPAKSETGAARKTLAELIDRYLQDVLSVRRKGSRRRPRCCRGGDGRAAIGGCSRWPSSP